MIRTIYVDMDCVLADFVAGIESRFDIELEDGFGYNMANYLDRSWEAVRHDLDEDFWHGLPLMPWSRQLMCWLNTLSDVYILTHAEMISSHIKGKLAWLHTYFPDQEVIFCRNKSLLARSTAMLIDDRPIHTNKWRANRGKAVLVPSRWKDTRQHVKSFNIFMAVASEGGYPYPACIANNNNEA